MASEDGALYGLGERRGTAWLTHAAEVVYAIWSLGVAIFLVRSPRPNGVDALA